MTKDIKLKLSNISYLTFLQVVQTVIGLLTIPIFTAKLGLSGFGIYVFWVSIFSITSVIGMIGVDQVQLHKMAISHDLKSDEKIVGASLQLRIPSLVVVSTGLILISLLINKDVPVPDLIVASLIFTLAISINFHWYFIAKGRALTTAIFDLSAKIFQLSACYLIVDEPIHAIYIFAGSQLFVSIGSIAMMDKRLFSGFFELKKYATRDDFARNGRIMLSNTATTFYSHMVSICIMSFMGPEKLGKFSVVEKVMSGCKSLFSPISKALTPAITQLLHRDEIGKKEAARIIFVIIFLFGLSLIPLALLTNPILLYLSGSSPDNEMVLLYKTLIFTIPLFVTTTLLGTNVVLAKGNQKVYSNVIIPFSLISLLAIVCSTYFGNLFEVGLTLVLIESVLAAVFFFYVKRLAYI